MLSNTDQRVATGRASLCPSEAFSQPFVGLLCSEESQTIHEALTEMVKKAEGKCRKHHLLTVPPTHSHLP